MMLLENKYNIGDIVFLKTDNDQCERIVTALFITKGEIQYQLSYGSETQYHYDFEISKNKNVLKSTS